MLSKNHLFFGAENYSGYLDRFMVFSVLRLGEKFVRCKYDIIRWLKLVKTPILESWELNLPFHRWVTTGK
jgi:hypothetical protein